MLSVYDFIEEHREQLRGIAVARLIADREDFHRRFLRHMANDMIIKKILANDYGNPTDFRLAKLCREWVRKNTECREG